ncbi:MAG: PqqD family peptide modification chaperone, partial [Pseudomonadota bacterium]
DWRTPDADYAWYPRYSSTDVFEFLRADLRSGEVPSYPRQVDGLDISLTQDDLYLVSGARLAEPHRLNGAAVLILELCSGDNTPAQIVCLLQAAFDLESAPEVVVLEFLSFAYAVGLIRGK